MATTSTSDFKQDEEHRQVAPSDLRSVETPAPSPPVPTLGNPTTLGFFSLATTTLHVGLMVVGVRGLASLTMLIGQVSAVGGLGMLISGFWCYQQGATFATTAFGMYGLFYISFGITLYPAAGASAGYEATADNNNALGIYLINWFVLSLVMFPVTWRLNVGLAFLFFLVTFYFLFLSIGFMMSSTIITKVGGYFGILVGCWGFVLGMEALYGAEDGIIKIPNPILARKKQ